MYKLQGTVRARIVSIFTLSCRLALNVPNALVVWPLLLCHDVAYQKGAVLCIRVCLIHTHCAQPNFPF